MKKPLIGITLDSEKKKTYSKFPWYALRENYLSSIIKFNAIPIPISHDKKLVKSYTKLLDALIILDIGVTIRSAILIPIIVETRISTNVIII